MHAWWFDLEVSRAASGPTLALTKGSNAAPQNKLGTEELQESAVRPVHSALLLQT